MANKLKDYEDTDSLHDPSNRQGHYSQTPDGSHDAIEGYDRANDGLDSHPDFSDPSRNIKNVSNLENQFNYPSAKPETTTPKSRRPLKSVLKGFINKKSATGGIIGGIIAILFGMGIMISPSLAIVHLKEVLTEDLNDQLAAMDIRSQVYMKAKFKDLGKKAGVCTLVKFRCELKGMTDKQIKNFEKAGIKVGLFEDEDSSKFGRKSIKSLTFIDSSGAERVVTNPSDFNKLLGDKNIRNQIRRAYNPLFYGFSDKVGVTRLGKSGGKAPIDGTSKESVNQAFDEAVRGETSDATARTQSADEDDPNKSQIDADNQASQDTLKGIEENTGGVRGVFGKATVGLGAAGTLSTACSIRTTGNNVRNLSKLKRAAQVSAAFVFIAKAADTIKAGDATPELAEEMGNKLGQVDSEKTIIDENSAVDKDGNAVEVDNPDYGKNAYDAQAVKAAMYNDAPTLSARSAAFAVGGGIVGSLSTILDKAEKVIPGSTESTDKTCKTVNSLWFQAGSLAVGVAAGVATLGASTLALGAGSIGLSLMLNVLQSYMADMIAGNVVTSKTAGVDLGNAAFSGAGVVMGDMAKARGMKPASESDLQEYTAHARSIKQEYIAMGVEDAKSTPFDVMNQYSFLGQLSRSILPATVNAKTNSIHNIASLFSASITSFIPKTSALGDFNPKRFQQCKDSGYIQIKVDADVMCNVRYALSDYELSLTIEEVYDFMYNDTVKYVDENGSPVGEYAEWVANCVDREAGWGETDEANGEDIGTSCVADDKKTSMFRVYTIDTTIKDGMDNGTADVTGTSLNEGASMRLATFNVRGASHTNGTYKARMDASIDVIATNKFDVIGFQELQEPQRNYFMQKQGSKYDIVPCQTCKTKTQELPNSIAWDKSKFRKISSGTMPNLRYFGGQALNAPFVLLEDIDGSDGSEGQQFYVLNTHDPTKPGAEATYRVENFKQHTRFIKDLIDKGYPVLMTGDFNSGYDAVADGGNRTLGNDPKNTAYCIMTSTGYINDAVDLSFDRQVKCPNKPPGDLGNPIDHIFASQGIDATGFTKIGKGYSEDANGSDHPTYFADMVIPGLSNSDSTSASEGSDIAGDDYAKECNKYLSSADCTGQCVGFVKFRLVKHGVIKSQPLGNGGSVTTKLRGLGFTVNRTPAVHAVMSTSKTSQPSIGHTAMVSQVNKDGSIVVEEYNYENPTHYGKRTITKQQIENDKSMTFAHTETKYK